MLKPIIFNTEMVKAILEGRKTQTRRLLKPQPPNNTFSRIKGGHGCDFKVADNYYMKPLYKVGDILYVRETWRVADASKYEEEIWIEFKAAKPYNVEEMTCFKTNDKDYIDKMLGYMIDAEGEGWKPSIHMPKKAARIFLKVTNVRVERLQNIKGEDIICEGTPYDEEIYNMPCNIENAGETYLKGCFMRMWNSIYGNWNENPWVWVIEFESEG